MKRYITLILLIGLTFNGFASTHLNNLATDIIANTVNENEPGVAVAISFAEQPIFKYQKGLANLEFKQPITENTRFNVASVSKQFTAFAILLLENEGKLKLSDPVYKYLPDMSLENRQLITIENLLNHTGGLRDVGTLRKMVADDQEVYLQSTFLNLLNKQQGLNFAPDSAVEYSNSGYFLLARIVESISEMSFADFTKKRIFEPLGMRESQFPYYATSVFENLADSYRPVSTGFATMPILTNIDGSTGLITTPADLLKWADNFTSQKVGNMDVLNAMKRRFSTSSGEPSTFAKGQELRIYKGLETWSHGGREAGFRSFLIRVPKHHLRIAITSNHSELDTAKLAFELVDLYLNDYLVSPESKETPEVSLDKLLGTYEIHPGLIFRIGSDDNKSLHFSQLGSEHKSPLKRINNLSYLLSPARDLKVNFVLNKDGEVIRFDYQIGLHGAIKAPRLVLPERVKGINLHELVGSYYSEEMEMVVNITTQQGQLNISSLTKHPVTLRPLDSDLFHAPGNAFQKIQFVRDSNNNVVSLLASGSLAKKIPFRRL